ncbi:polyadenylate-binding protein 3, partial [Eutrema salsugineum]|uniref:polyadenylate-binding protein 3 n=1 Tax=Eutrema salsugineum TaxID=72664 RepID=UPI000CED0424
LVTKSDQANSISSLKVAAVRKKTLFVRHLSPQTKVSDLIDFFKDVGEVVRVRLPVNRERIQNCSGFVEFASASQAKKALEEKKGKYLHDRKILLVDANREATYPLPKYEDYLQRESLPILPIKEDETPPDFVEDVLFVANLSPQTKRMSHIIDFFKDVGEVVSVRLVVDGKGNHLGYGFVEFASAYQAKRALEEKNGAYLHDHKILLMKGLDETPDSLEAAAVRNKTLFVVHRSRQILISDIINFFKDIGEVVHVRLIVNCKGKQLGYGFVEFASANEAKMALEKKNGECLDDRKIFLRVVETAPYPLRPKYCIDHKVWYEDYLQRERLLIEEDTAGKGLEDKTPDFVEEVAVRKKTLFVDNLSKNISKSYMNYYFKDVGKVVRIRLIVDHRGEHVGCGYVEFASANEAMKALKEKNNHTLILDKAEIAPYPFQLKYNIAEKLWYEDCFRRFSLDLETKPDVKKHKPLWRGKKTIFSAND